MTEDKAFIEAITASPTDDTIRLVYADWLDERNDPRGQLIRAWYTFYDACLVFRSLSPSRDTEEFERCRAAVMRYQELAQVVNHEWLYRLGATRAWVNQECGLIALRVSPWLSDRDWRSLDEGRTTDLDRAWMYCFENRGPQQPGTGRNYASWYIVHKYLGSITMVGSPGPKLALWQLEGRP